MKPSLFPIPTKRKPGCLCLIACLALLGSGTAPAQQGNAGKPTVDPETGIIHSQRLESGVPFGGIGTGTFQLLTDGSISKATFNNNWHQPTGDLPASFAAVWMRMGTRSVARVLALKNAYKLPSVTALDYAGLYPQARLTFPDPDLPIGVTLRAFSPLIPFDLKNSSFPAAAFIFQVKNTALVPVEISLALSWENILGVGGTAARGPFHDRTGNLVAPLPATEGFFGLKFTGPTPTSEATGDALLRQNASGEYTLLANPERPDATVTTAGWNALSARPPWWDTFARDGSVSGEAPPGVEGKTHPAGVVAVRLILKPGDFISVPFAFSWRTPHLYALSGTDYGHYYEIAFPDSTQSARALLTDWRSLISLTEEWHKRLLFSTLPRPLARRLINCATPLTTHSIHTRDGRFALLENVGSNPNADAVRRGELAVMGDIRHRLAVSSLLLAFFPTLHAQELSQFARMPSPFGGVPRTLGDLDRTFGIPNPSDVTTPPPDARAPLPLSLPDSSSDDPTSASAFLVQIAQYVSWTGDTAFLELLYPRLRLALHTLTEGVGYRVLGVGEQKTKGIQDNPNRPITQLPNYPTPNTQHPTPTDASLHLAALRAGADLASKAGDKDFAQDCRRAYEAAAAAFRARFWNGEFYAEGGAEAEPAAKGSGVSRADQLLGQWAADMLGLGLLQPREDVGKALLSLQAHHDKGMGLGPPLAVSVNGKPLDEPDARDCLPSVSLLAQASLYITQGQAGAGVALLQRLDETRNNVLRSPWQSAFRFRADTGVSATPGVASMTEAADWNALYALEGFTWDQEAGNLSLAPNMPGTWRALTAPVFAPTFWGTAQFRPTARGGVLTFRLDRLIALTAATPARSLGGSARLVIKSLLVPGPPSRPEATPPTAHVSLGRAPIGSHATQEASGALTLTFDAPLILTAGDRLEIDIH